MVRMGPPPLRNFEQFPAPVDTWRRLVAVLAFTLSIALLPLPASPASTRDDAVGSTVSRATLRFESGKARDVTLPHTWVLDGLPNAGSGHYHADLDLPNVPDTAWSIGADRLSSRCAVRVNDSLVHATLAEHDAGHRAAPVPTLIDLPPALLRAGRNSIDIDVTFDARGGMSPLRIGPTDWVRQAYARAETFGFTVPQALNVGAAVLALFMLTIWIRRRSETELGAFCALMVVVSLRNIVSTGVGNDWHSGVVDLAIFLAQVASMVLLAWFGMAFAQRDWPVFRRVVKGVGLALLAAALLASWRGAMLALRVWTYPVVLALLLPSVWLIVAGARRSRGLRQATLTLAIMLLVGAAVHDYFFLRGYTSVMDRYWMPFTSPLALLIFAWALLDRFVGALAAMESQSSELEHKVAERTRQLEVANAAKTRFLAAASHDLRQPVVSISLLSELLREQALPAAAGPILARIGDSVQALNGLLKGLLDLSRFDAGVVEARMAPFALRPLLDRAVGDEAEAARRKRISLRVHASAALSIHSDPALIEQILRNLVANAVRYTSHGGVLVSARRRLGERVLMQVWDTGTGIPAESRTHVFDEFVQLDDGARERQGGLGLGLSLVKRAADVLGSPVTLRSTVGRGSCFSIELPLAAVEWASKATTQLAQFGEFGLRGWHVWVVEDDSDVREAIRLRLVDWGAAVQVFASVGAVRDALAQAGSTRPGLLVCDQRLPDGTGQALVQSLRVTQPDLKVLVVTGDTAPHDIARLRASGLPVLHKPFTSEDLRTALGPMVWRDKSADTSVN